ncbi:MAG: TetR/AcrR family transcriptional regulator [Alphaproteobacteria bacterium]|jgi:AcrR family transcriptional regulator|nr:TetR/AcrR family transcriptional regulator [Alphaproteobacteria bacterium]
MTDSVATRSKLGAARGGGPNARLPAESRARRQNNRRQEVLDAAAACFAGRGYRATTMREIAAQAGMLPGSIYYHFPSKEELLLAVYEEGVRRIEAVIDGAVAAVEGPWARLEAACAAHLEAILDESDYARVIIRVLPEDAGEAAAALVALRDRYEGRFRALFQAVPLAAGADRGALRLLLIGAMNWSQVWYRPGREPPAALARTFVRALRPGAEVEAAP